MPQHVLVPIDGSDQSWAAFDYAIREHAGGTITILHVINPVDAGLSTGSLDEEADVGAEWYARAADHADSLFEEAVDRAADHGVEIDTDRQLGGPADIITRYADAHDVDHIVVGSRGRTGISRLLLGSVAETVVRRASVPVTVVR